MGVVGPVGVWDKELHARYATLLAARPHTRANDALERALLGQILEQNAPLIRHFVARLHGPHIDRLGHEEVEATVRIAFVRAVQTYDSTKGGIAGWFAWRLRPEIERAERLDCIVKGKARTRAPDVAYLGEEDGELVDEAEGKMAGKSDQPIRVPIFLSEAQKRAIEKKSLVSISMIKNYARGRPIGDKSLRRIEGAMKELGFARVERRQWSPARRAPEIEAAPASSV